MASNGGSRSGALLPRVYQEEAVKIAATRNTICRMDTGTGKTLIAVMLTQHILSLPANSGESLAVFIVPTVSLVDQTASVLRAQTKLRVRTFSGTTGTDFHKRELWVAQLRQAQVVVCTAQIWLNALTNSYWDMSKTSVLVFDEAHHATKNHPYCRIMKDHYHTCTSSRRPRILGLTASPVWNAKNPDKAIVELESNLDCRIYEVASEHGLELAEHSAKPSEQLVLFSSPASSPLSWTTTEAEHLLFDHYGVGKLDSRLTVRLADTRQHLGALGTTIYADEVAKQLKAPKEVSRQLSQLRKAMPVDELTTSAHVRALLHLLARYAPTEDTLEDRSDFHAIIFVQQRQHTQILAEIVARDPALADWLRPACLVGHGGGNGNGNSGMPDDDFISEKGMGMKSKEQQAVVSKFRTGEFNLLFATQVAEEGLDFRTCNCVIRFDGLQTMTGYIQSRGRARSVDSDYIVLAERGSAAAAAYHKYLQSEPMLRALYTSRPTDQQAPEPELESLPVYVVPTTNARLTFQAAVPLLFQYCDVVVSEGDETAQRRPEYFDSGTALAWVCTLRTPNIKVLGGVRIFESEPARQKKIARQAVAFAACVELHKAGGLSDHLQPPRKVSGVLTAGAFDVDGRAVDYAPMPETGKWIPYEPGFGDVGRPNSPVWSSVVEIEEEDGTTHRVALVCGTNLASYFSKAEACGADLAIFSEGKAKLKVRVPRSELLTFASKKERDTRIEQLRKLDWGAAKTVINRRLRLTEVDAFVALWAPLTEDGTSIDWAKVERPYGPAKLEELTTDSILILRSTRPATRLGRFVKVRDDVDTHSRSSDIENKLPTTSQRYYMLEKYPKYSSYCRVALDYKDVNDDVPEPIIEFDPSPMPQYTLADGVATEPIPEGQNLQRPFPLGLCSLSVLSASFWKVFSSIPSLERLIDDVVQLGNLMRKYEFPPIHFNKLREALTPPSVCAGFDYQYLETIGDSVLKIATTLHIYLSRDTADEGMLSILRHHSVSNACLRGRSLESGFASYILAAPYSPLQWSPGEGDGGRERGDVFERRIGRRALADTIEAILGAAFATGGLDTAMVVGDKLGLCFGGTTPWKERPEALELTDLPSSPVPAPLKELEKKLGHKFRQGALLVEAMTHRSYGTIGICYDRLEYLGDAILDFWAIGRLFALFPNSTPQHVTNLRTILVSNASLGYTAIKKLELHKFILRTSPLWKESANKAVEQTKAYNVEQVVSGDLTWLWDPPKALGDCLEASLGAIFIDSNFEFGPVFAALDRLYGDLMPLITSVEISDPHSQLLNLVITRQCRKTVITYEHTEIELDYVAECTFHGINLGTERDRSKTVAKQLVSRHALDRFQEDPELLNKCDCASQSITCELKMLKIDVEMDD